MSEHYQKPNLETEYRYMLTECAKKFIHSPRNSYLDSLAKEFSKRLKPAEVEKILTGLHLKKSTFPSMTYFDVEMRAAEKLRYQVKKTSNGHVLTRMSPKVLGVPVIVEALFHMIQRGDTDTGAWNYARKMCKLSEDELMKAYEAWVDGQLHELLKKKEEVPNIFG